MSANWKTCPGWCGYIENAKRHFMLYCYPMDEVAPAKMYAPLLIKVGQFTGEGQAFGDYYDNSDFICV